MKEHIYPGVAFFVLLFFFSAAGSFAQTLSPSPLPTDPPLPACSNSAYDEAVDIETLEARHDDTRVLVLLENRATRIARCLPQYDARSVNAIRMTMYEAAKTRSSAADLAMKLHRTGDARRNATMANAIFKQLQKMISTNDQWALAPAQPSVIRAEILANDDLLARLNRKGSPQSI